MRKVRRGVNRMARRAGDGLPKGMPGGSVWYSRIKCPRCGALCAAEHCMFGKFRIFCETPRCGYVICSDMSDGLGQ